MESDWVSQLQRYCVSNSIFVTYNSASSGKQHAPTHSVTVSVNGVDGTELTVTEKALKKKDAKQLAARALWTKLQERNSTARVDDKECTSDGTENYVGRLQVCLSYLQNDLCVYYVLIIYPLQHLCQMRQWKDNPVYKVEAEAGNPTGYVCTCVINVSKYQPKKDSICTLIHGKLL